MSMHNSGRNDTKNPGGSVGFDRLKAVYTPANVPDSRESFDTQTSEQTLGDYIARKQLAASFDAVNKEKKLSFDEWLHHRFPAGVDGYAYMLNIGDLEQCWKAAQENK